MPFDGSTYEPPKDKYRLTTQLAKTKALMSDGLWRTLEVIAGEIGSTTQGASARLRDLRKQKFGGHTVNRKRITKSVFAYQLIVR